MNRSQEHKTRSERLTVFLFLKVTFTAQPPTTTAPSTATGAERCPDPRPRCSW